jgi:hypothetical protein
MVRAVVVYESLWGNTAALGRAVATGIGSMTRAWSTIEISPESVVDADLLVLGAPVHSFGLRELAAIEAIRKPVEGTDAPAPEVERQLMRRWLTNLPPSDTSVAVFETRIQDLVGEGGAPDLVEALTARGYRLVVPVECFQVERLPIDSGPGSWVRPGETERAREWGKRLAATVLEE